MLRNIYYLLPVSFRYFIRRLIFMPTDLLTKRHELEPPKGKIFTGSGDFIKVGEEFFDYFKTYGDIKPNSSILDVGSGIGRMAVPFTKFLDKSGSYKGFDIVKQGVYWCTKNISSKYPNFTFTYVPLKNGLYNMVSKEKAINFTFPYESDTFDFVFLTSVFTHMLPDEMSKYLIEINRVLKSNKKCLATFFILDKTSRHLMKNSVINFKQQNGEYATINKKVKEANVAYNKDYLFKIIQESGFNIENYFEGTWSGKTKNTLSYQDILILKKAIKC